MRIKGKSHIIFRLILVASLSTCRQVDRRHFFQQSETCNTKQGKAWPSGLERPVSYYRTRDHLPFFNFSDILLLMLDIKFIQDNKEVVAKALTDKNREPVDLDKIIDLYDKRKEIRQTIDGLNAKKNEAAKERNVEAGKAVKESLQSAEEELRQVEKEFLSLMVKIPNIPSIDTPIGKDESENKTLRQVGEKPKFDYTPKPHWEIGKDLGIIDNESAAEVSGARFTYLKNDLVLMQFALIQFAFDVLTDEELLASIAKETGLDIKVTPFMPVIPPTMVKPGVLNRMARLDPKEDKYHLEADDLYLTGSAEHTLGPIHMDKVIPEDDLPIRYVGYSTAFRREAGSYGKDTKGILRMHQFDKLEMETFVMPEQSYMEQDFLVAIQEYLMTKLGLPYQVVAVCTGDMGFPDHRQIDIETWMPGQDVYRETHSADLIGGFQPRRLNTKVKRADGKNEHVHMNDATAFAIGRTLIAILENYQQKDGSVKVPAVLHKYMKTDLIK